MEKKNPIKKEASFILQKIITKSYERGIKKIKRGKQKELKERRETKQNISICKSRRRRCVDCTPSNFEYKKVVLVKYFIARVRKRS